MTGLEPHPILRPPTAEEIQRVELAQGREAAAAYARAKLAERATRMQRELDDPFTYGYESPIWHIVDDLLCDGREVLLDLPEGVTVPPPIIKGAPEILVTGWNRSSKSEYCGKKCMKILHAIELARGWSFSDTEKESRAKQQPIFWKYMPWDVKRIAAQSGKAKQGAIRNVSYTQKNGFSENTFVLPNGAQHWFNNYAQEEANLEGDQLDVAWFDELRNPELVKTVRFRMGDRAGLILVSFTPITIKKFGSAYNEYQRGARTVLEVEAELLPIRDEHGRPTGDFEKVPRVAIAGPGSDGTQRANIVYFHISDNPYYGFQRHPKPGVPQLSPKDIFRRFFAKATREVIRARAYAILDTTVGALFKFNAAWHVVPHEQIPAGGTNYQIIDPCPGRNWFAVWVRVIAIGPRMRRLFFYREWPSYGHPDAFIPGHGDIGPWAKPGNAPDGDRGSGQDPLYWGLDRYKEEFLRREGHKAKADESNIQHPTSNIQHPTASLPGDVIKPRPEEFTQPRRRVPVPVAQGVEIIFERLMDSRGGADPQLSRGGRTTIMEQLNEMGFEVRPASGREIDEGIELVRNGLDYDEDTPRGQYSPRLARVNEPLIQVSDRCPNVIYALTEYTGLDGQHGAMKDVIDDVRYAVTDELDYFGEGAGNFQWHSAAR